MCIYIYIFIYILHMHLHVHLHAHVRAHTHARTHTHIYRYTTYMHSCIYERDTYVMCTLIYAHVYLHACTHTVYEDVAHLCTNTAHGLNRRQPPKSHQVPLRKSLNSSESCKAAVPLVLTSAMLMQALCKQSDIYRWLWEACLV